MLRPKYWAAFAAALMFAMAGSLVGPTDARADRCNPDEMIGPAYTAVVGKPYTPVFGEDDGPFCYAMKTQVYPAIGCDPVYQSLVACLQSQPARARLFAGDMCRETMAEIRQAYYYGPVRPPAVDAAMAAFSATFRCSVIG